MRLTLRTMLAYMDDIDDLARADHEELGRKIEESEFASTLLHRIRDVSRRMRLGAPKTLGRGLGVDPNTVAEYLDNTLTGERVPELEKVCLESDVHLAEVACCHQILTLVLREPAEVDPALRRRIYAIDTQSEPATTGLEPEPVVAGAAGPVGAGAAAGMPPLPEHRGTAVRERLEVPEYLRRGSRSRFWPIAITVALALGLMFVVVSALGPLDATNPALKWLLGGGKKGTDVAQNSDTKPPKETPPGDPDDKKQPEGATPPATPDNASRDKDSQPAVDKAGSPDAKQTGTAVEPVVPATSGPPTSGNAGLNQPKSVPPPAPVPDDRAAPVAPPPPAIDAKGGAPATQVPGVALPAAPTAAPPGDFSVPPAPAGNSGPPPAEPPPAAANEAIGRFTSEQEVLLQLDAGQTEWHRVTPGATFRRGDKLLALPTFRPKITLSGLEVTLYPETLVDLLGNDAQGIPALRINFGRVQMATPARPDMRLRLSLGRSGGTLVFIDPQATAAAEVRPYQLPGTDPEANPPRIGVALYATSGQVEWQADGAGDLPPAAGGRLKAPGGLILAPFLADPGVPGSDRELPKWLGVETLSLLDVRASQALNQAFDGKDAVTVVMREMAGPGQRRTENRSLAARCLALIDEFDPFVELLNDPDQKAIWAQQIDSVQAALGRGPNVAVKIRTTFERQVGKDGDDLYRMLWGYGREDLQGGSAATLVDMLDNDSSAFSLAFRVLSFQNLRTITGATFNYRPEATAAARAPAVRRWREQLKGGLIVPKGSGPAKPATEAPVATGLPPVSPAKAPPPPQPEN